MIFPLSPIRGKEKSVYFTHLAIGTDQDEDEKEREKKGRKRERGNQLLSPFPKSRKVFFLSAEGLVVVEGEGLVLYG